MRAAGCVFCRIVRGEAPAEIVRRDAEVVAFRDINPQAPIHILVIPQRHIESVNAVEPGDAELIGKLYLVAKLVAEAEGVARTGYRIVVNTGPDSGQSVPHLHLHVLGGRALRWPPG